MKLAEAIGGSFILVLSGETKRDMVEDSENTPDLIVEHVWEYFLKLIKYVGYLNILDLNSPLKCSSVNFSLPC